MTSAGVLLGSGASFARKTIVLPDVALRVLS